MSEKREREMQQAPERREEPGGKVNQGRVWRLEESRVKQKAADHGAGAPFARLCARARAAQTNAPSAPGRRECAARHTRQ
jgi:hypothetical protein